MSWEALYVSDGSAGLKLFNITDPVNLWLEKEFEDLQIFDVIPLNNTLLMVDDDIFYQYEYQDNSLNLISSLQMN